MRFKAVCSLVGVLLFALSCSAHAGWHDETQATRNQQIVNQANHDLGLVGGACKVWAYDVVRVASNLAGGPNIPVYLPLNDNYAGNGNGYAWFSDPNVVSYGPLAANSMQPA